MKYDPNIHHRRSIRLKGYDYSRNGAYFVTICTQNREQIFGKIIDGKMILNDAGQIAHYELAKTSEIRKNFQMDCWMVMPNHIHAIVVIDNPIDIAIVGAYCHTPDCVSPDCNVPGISNQPNRAYCNTPECNEYDRNTSGYNEPNNPNQPNRAYGDHGVRAYGNTPQQTRILQSPSNNLGSMVRGYKSTVAKQINQFRNTPGFPIWQRNYHEHIIRHDLAYEKIYNYIIDNTERWEEDVFFGKSEVNFLK
jgi:REP element-mobilizing transposase RayT